MVLQELVSIEFLQYMFTIGDEPLSFIYLGVIFCTKLTFINHSTVITI